MNYENIKIEPINNGFKASVEIPKKILDLELNEYINRVDEINMIVINNKNELYIRELLNRIDKALKYLDKIIFDEYGVMYDNGSSILKYEHDFKDNLLEILKGDSNE